MRRFFCAAVRKFVVAYENLASLRVTPVTPPYICEQIRLDIAAGPHGYSHSPIADHVVDIPVVESLSPLTLSSATQSPVVDTPARSLTPNNRSLTYLQAGPFDPPHCHVPLARGAVSSVLLASTDLLDYIEPQPLDQLVCHSARTVRSWPATACDELLAVAHRDMAMARINMEDLTRYLDMHSAHLVACSGAMDDAVHLMSVETFPRATGGSGRLSTRLNKTGSGDQYTDEGVRFWDCMFVCLVHAYITVNIPKEI